MNNKIICLLSVIIATVAFFSETTSAASQSNTLVIANSLQADSLDPVRVFNDTKFYMTLIYDSLVGVTPEGKISKETGIAHDWQRSSDGKTWIFHLRQGIKFHNGDELTADDVKFSIERFLSPYSVSAFSPTLRKTIKKVETLDKYTVKINCKDSAPLLLYDLSSVTGMEGYILPKKYIEEFGDLHFGQNPIGTGPYKVVEAVSGYHIEMEAAFEKHWLLGRLNFKKLLLRYAPEELARIAMVEIGEADIAAISVDQIVKLREKGFTILQDPGNGVAFIAPVEQWNEKHPVHKKKVRQALALAIDGKGVFEHLYHGIGRLVGNGNAVKGSIGYIDHPPYPFDPQKSKELLKEAGYPNGFELKLHSYPTGTGFPYYQSFLEIVANSFEKIGVKCKIIPYANYGSWRAKFVVQELGNSLMGNSSGGRSNPLKSMHLWWTKDSMFRLAEVSELSNMIERATETLDENERKKLIKEISDYNYKNYNFLWTMELSTPYVISKKIKPWNLGYVPYDINLQQIIK